MQGDKKRDQAASMNASLLRPLALLWLAGVMLRLTTLALPPVLQAVEAEFRLRGSAVGVLTAIPALFFAVAAVPGAVLIKRFGAVRSLLTGLLVNALGAAARGFSGDVIELELTTAIMCLGGRDHAAGHADPGARVDTVTCRPRQGDLNLRTSLR